MPQSFYVEVVDDNLTRVGDGAAVAARDFTVRSDLPVCQGFGGDLAEELLALGVVPECPANVVSFVRPDPAGAPWLWNVSYVETLAGEYYIDVFFRDGNEVGAAPLQISRRYSIHPQANVLTKHV